MLPILKLAPAHIKRNASNGGQEHILIPHQKLSARIAHRGAAIAAASRLMKHQLPCLASSIAISSTAAGVVITCSGTAVIAASRESLIRFRLEDSLVRSKCFSYGGRAGMLFNWAGGLEKASVRRELFHKPQSPSFDSRRHIFVLAAQERAYRFAGTASVPAKPCQPPNPPISC